MLMRSVDDKMVTEMLPKTFKSMEKWDGQDLPPEEVFEAFYFDFQKLIEEEREGKLSTQLNYTKNGLFFNGISNCTLTGNITDEVQQPFNDLCLTSFLDLIIS